MFVCHMLNKIKNLLSQFKQRKCATIKSKIKELDSSIRRFFTAQKNLIKRSIYPNNSKSLWDAVKIAKNLNVDTIPSQMSIFMKNVVYKWMTCSIQFSSMQVLTNFLIVSGGMKAQHAGGFVSTFTYIVMIILCIWP